MNEPKPFASLSSGLLARKGAAKPAMRPQGFGHVAAPAIEDLGWNDMGQAPQDAAAPYPFHEEPERRPSSISALTPASSNRATPVEDEDEYEAAPETPQVVEQQRAIAATFAPEPVELPKAKTAAQPAGKTKAAFTLRLDAERHLKLRLASVTGNRSAQQIVTEALDEFLQSRPELETLARQVPAQRASR